MSIIDRKNEILDTFTYGHSIFAQMKALIPEKTSFPSHTNTEEGLLKQMDIVTRNSVAQILVQTETRNEDGYTIELKKFTVERK